MPRRPSWEQTNRLEEVLEDILGVGQLDVAVPALMAPEQCRLSGIAPTATAAVPALTYLDAASDSFRDDGTSTGASSNGNLGIGSVTIQSRAHGGNRLQLQLLPRP